MKCSECHGACCEQIVFPAPSDRASLAFLLARGEGERGPKKQWVRIVLDTRCPKLTDDGRCGIYESRPLICAEYEPGGTACLAAVRRRRTPEDFQRIREEGDPAR